MSAKIVLLKPKSLYAKGRVFERGVEHTVSDEVAKYLRENFDGHFEIDFTVDAEADVDDAGETAVTETSVEDAVDAAVRAAEEGPGETAEDAEVAKRQGGVRITKGKPKAKTAQDDGADDAVEIG